MEAAVGGVYYVADSKLTLPPDQQREVHASRRPFVVLSGSEFNSDGNWTTVLGCPLSSSTRFRTRLCVRIAAGEADCAKKSWVRVPALQPVRKSDLSDLVAHLPAEKLQLVQARVLKYMGLLDATGPAESGADQHLG